MGSVYRAEKDGQTFAVKILLVDEESASSTMAARFKREIDACRGLDHPHIVKIYEAGTEEDCYWYAMDLLEGRDLRRWMKKRRLDRKQVVRITRELVSALGHIHEKGVIHRDLKPGNIMIEGGTGRTVLMDFGLAKVEDRTRITKTGHGLGTPRYMAPEMLLARPPSPATDLYQVGIILYEMLTGATVVKAKSFATLAHELTRVYPKPVHELDPELGDTWNTFVFNCIEKDQARRYQNAAEFLADLDKVVAGETISPRGDQRVLKLGESSDEVDTDAVTAEFDSKGGSAPALPAQAPAPKDPISASFSSLRPSVALESGGFAGLLADPDRGPQVLRGAGFLLGAFLGIMVGLFLTQARWDGNTRLQSPVRIRTSSHGLECQFRSESRIPTAIRLRDQEGQERIFRAQTNEPGQEHRLVLADLPAGKHDLEVLFPDGSGAHSQAVEIPESAQLSNLDLSPQPQGGSRLGFRMNFPVRGKARLRLSDTKLEESFGPKLASSWTLDLEKVGPFVRVEDLYLDLEGAAGWKESYGPYLFEPLDQQILKLLAEQDPRLWLDNLEARRLQGGDLEDLVQERLKENGSRLTLLLDRFRHFLYRYYRSDELDFERRRAFYSQLLSWVPLEFYLELRSLPPRFGLERLVQEWIRVLPTVSFEGVEGAGLDRFRKYQSPKSETRPALLPQGMDQAVFQRLCRTVQAEYGGKLRPLARKTYEFHLPKKAPDRVELELVVQNMYPESYLAVRLNESVQVFLREVRPDRSVQELSERKPGRRWASRFVIQPPAEVLRAGRNFLQVELHRLVGLPPLPTALDSFAVYYDAD